MKRQIIKRLSTVLILFLFISACGQNDGPLSTGEFDGSETPQMSTATSTEEIVKPSPTQEPATATLTEEITARFTIQADVDLLPAVTVLYEAFYDGEKPVFVETGADLLATHPENEDGIHPSVEATFLPGSVLIPLSDVPEVADFIAYAISVEGQQNLIDAGALPKTVTLTDQSGMVVEIEQPVRRVISSHGPTTAIVYSVGAEDRLVAASYLGARDPLGTSVMEKMDARFPGIMGDDMFSQDSFNIEEAVVLEPDLILTSARSAWIDTVAELDIPVVLFEAEAPERLKEAVLLVGQLLGPHNAAQAQAWVHYYEATLEAIQDGVASIPFEERPRVLFTGTEPLRVVSGDMYQTDLIQAAGGLSVSSELSGYWNNVNLEQIVLWEPDVILVPPYGGASVEAITTSPEWQIIDAVQEGRVYRMPKLVAPWDTPAPDSVLGMVWLAERLYPQVVPMTCDEEAVYFYNTFYNYDITVDEIETICAIK